MCFKKAQQLAKFTSKRTYITTVLSSAEGNERKHSSKGERSDQQSSGLTTSNTGELTQWSLPPVHTHRQAKVKVQL